MFYLHYSLILIEKPLSQRIIPDIKNLDQALKIVRDTESAYYRTIEENVSYWWAVKEDIKDSYTKLINQTEDEKVKSMLSKIISDLEHHIEVLESMRKSCNGHSSNHQAPVDRT